MMIKYLHFRNNFANTRTFRKPFHTVVTHKSTSEELVPRSLTDDLMGTILINRNFRIRPLLTQIHLL